MIISETVEITISNNGAYYRNLGYGDCIQRDKIMVKLEHIPLNCNKKVLCECDDCGESFERQYQILKRAELNSGKHQCRSCSYDSRTLVIDYSKVSESNRKRIGDIHPRWNPDKSKFSEYKRKVDLVVRKQPLHTLPNHEKKRGLCGVTGAYQLDHIIPQKIGFEMGIPPEIIGNILNLRFISWEENRQKSTNITEEHMNKILSAINFVAVRSSASFTEIAG
jgi:hypothetical protein